LSGQNDIDPPIEPDMSNPTAPSDPTIPTALADLKIGDVFYGRVRIDLNDLADSSSKTGTAKESVV
jgi:hypothetical protein